MPRVLHILTRSEDAFSREIVRSQQAEYLGEGIEVVDLTTPRPDYEELLKKVFEADSVECW
jgi:hypothetical protein